MSRERALQEPNNELLDAWKVECERHQVKRFLLHGFECTCGDHYNGELEWHRIEVAFRPEGYPGQKFFHAGNKNIKRAEENFERTQAAPQEQAGTPFDARAWMEAELKRESLFPRGIEDLIYRAYRAGQAVSTATQEPKQ